MASGSKRKRSGPTGCTMGAFIDLTGADDEAGSQGECEVVSVAPPKTSSSQSSGRSSSIPRQRGAEEESAATSDSGECQFVSVSASSSSRPSDSATNAARSSRSNSAAAFPLSGSSTNVDDDTSSNDVAYAAALQEDEQRQGKQSKHSTDGETSDDAAYAAALQQDEKLALSIKEEEIDNLRETVRAEHAAMATTNSGRAWLFVQRVLATHAKLKSTTTSDSSEIDSQINAVAVDDMVYLTERMLDLQAAFRTAGKPCHVDVGYHYTRAECMGRIRTDGLMTHAERRSNNIRHHNGSAFGDGVYTGNNPFAFRLFGEVGLLVARMQGETSRGTTGVDDGAPPRADTVIGNKGGLGGTDFGDEVVLRNSSQCVPVVRFASSLISPSNDRGLGNEVVHVYHREVQEIVDEFFNDGQRTEVIKVLPSSGRSRNVAHPFPTMPPQFGQAAFNMTNGMMFPPPQMFPGPGHRLNGRNGAGASFSSGSRALPYNSEPKEVLEYVAPYVLDEPDCAFQDLTDDAASNGECTICLDSLLGSTSGKAVGLKVCKHTFHLTCIKDALSHSNKCPVCRKTVGEVQGKSPSGTMCITRTPVECRGHEGCGGSILITYDVPGSVQRIYHDNPGQRYAGATRTAYLPDNDEGKSLLRRLKYAFMKGLTFVVGTSMTTGQQNCVTWGSIHHKTHPSGGVGAHGFPDDGYLVNCNEELDGLGVPPAEDCKEKGVVQQTPIM